MLSAESLGFLCDELDCREFVVEQFQCGILALLLVPFYINENVDTVNGYRHRTNSSTQVFCNTSATGVKMRLRVQVLT